MSQPTFDPSTDLELRTGLTGFVPALMGQHQPTDATEMPQRKEVVFIDTSVADWQTLAKGVRPGVEVVLINASQSGLAQMAEWAQSQSGYDAIHVLSHGSQGTVQLGRDTLNQASVATAGVQAELAPEVRHLFAKVWVFQIRPANKFNNLRLFLIRN